MLFLLFKKLAEGECVDFWPGLGFGLKMAGGGIGCGVAWGMLLQGWLCTTNPRDPLESDSIEGGVSWLAFSFSAVAVRPCCRMDWMDLRLKAG